jgi:hypothetical protein
MALEAIFWLKKGQFKVLKGKWHEPIGISFLVTYGILLTVATNVSFY